MRRAQFVAVAICVALTALDGFDVLSISFASPGIAAEWGIDRAMLGIVLSMELIGMSAGSMFVGSLADRVGRRPVDARLSRRHGDRHGARDDRARRHDAVGVPALHRRRHRRHARRGQRDGRRVRERAAAEPRRRAHGGGYPLGAIVGGSIASRLLAGGSWRSVFAFGALVSAAFIPLVWFLVPETIAYLAHRRPANVLERVNAVLRRLGHRDGDRAPRAEPRRATRAAGAALHARASRARRCCSRSRTSRTS